MAERARTSRQAELRVAELAEELGITPEKALELARSRNVWAKSPNTKLRSEDADLLRLVWRARERYRENLREQAAEDSELATIRHNLGLAAQSSARKPAPVKRREPLTGTAAAAVRRWPGTSDETARWIAEDWTGRLFITDTQAAAWWSAGLTWDDGDLALVLAELGIKPEHLTLTIRGETILYRLRNGVAPEQVKRVLHNEGIL